MTCFDAATDEGTFYLAGTPINVVAVAPDGTVWAVGGYDGEDGGLYRITRDFSTNAATTYHLTELIHHYERVTSAGLGAPNCRSSQVCRDASATERLRSTFGGAGLPATRRPSSPGSRRSVAGMRAGSSAGRVVGKEYVRAMVAFLTNDLAAVRNSFHHRGQTVGESGGDVVQWALPLCRWSDESRLGEGWIRVVVEALASRDPEVASLDELLVDVAGGLQRLGVGGGLADQLGDVVHNAEAI